MVPFESLCTVSYSHFITTIAVFLAVFDIEYRDLGKWVSGRSRSLKIARFDRQYDFLLIGHCNYIALFCTVFELFDKLHWVATRRCKKFEDMFSRFDRIPACDGQTDGHLATA